MKKTVALIAFLACLALILPLCVTCFALLAPPQFDESFLGELPCKIERLDSIEGPKAVIIGGSSVAFGLRSDLLEKEIGMPVVNFGLYASLGTKIMLDLSKKSIGKGDVIVIAPEQDSQTLSTYFNADSALKAFDGSFKYLLRVDSADRPALLGALASFTGEKFKFFSSGKPQLSGVYTKDSFNGYGDIAYERPENTMFGSFDKNTPISFDTSVISPEFIDYLNDYADFARSKGALVYFSFSPMNRAALKESTTSEDIYAYFKHLQSNLDFPVISSPETYLMDSEWFYDSNFHMNDAGALLHTRHLAMDLILALGISRECGIAEPEKPAKPDDTPVTDPDQKPESSFFLFKESSKGLELTGLTEEGAKQTSLELPAEVDGKRVVAIAEGAFSSASKVTHITLNQGLTYISNGAFNGCSSLTHLIMNVNTPAAVRVDELLLEGAESCKVYVPKDAYGAYVTDYYWAMIFDQDLIEMQQ